MTEESSSSVSAIQQSFRLISRHVRPYARLIINPLDRVFDPAQRQQARLLNYLLLPIFAALIFLFNWSGSPSDYALYVALNLIVIVAAYVLNRVGYYLAAATTVSLLVSASAFLNFALKINTGVPLPEISLMRVIPALLVGYLLLPMRGVLVFSIANALGVLVAMALTSGDHALMTTTFFFTLIVAALVVIAAQSRDHYVTQIEQQSRELIETEARYRNLLNASFETLLVHKDGTIIDANPSVEQLIGYLPEEVVGTSALDYIEPVHHAQVIASYRNNVIEPYEILLRHKNGTAIHVEIRGKAQWYRGQLVRVVAIRDITERKVQEELGVEREKVRVLQNFIANLSHDLRTPLSVINTSIYLIDRLAQDPDRQHHHIDVLQSQAVRMQRLLEDLISMARLDKADTSDFRFRWVNINQLVDQAIKDNQNLALRKKQVLSCELADSLPDVLLDGEQFRLALKHLILNGLSYTAENGTVTVVTYAEAADVVVEVRDNGVGIQPLDLPHIFEHFYRGDRARGEEGGTGVGLTLAKKIVEAHGGRIHSDQSAGKGQYLQYLPAHPARRAGIAD